MHQEKNQKKEYLSSLKKANIRGQPHTKDKIKKCGTNRRFSWLFSILVLSVAILLINCAGVQKQSDLKTPGSQKYGYYYKGQFVSLTASKRLIAIREIGVAFSPFVKAQGLKRHPLSNREPLKGLKIGLYSLPAPARKIDKRIDLSVKREDYVRTTGEEIQPVFEQGQSLLIPSDEVIVGFKEATSLDQARKYFAPYRKTQGINEIRKHRKNSYIVTIDNPSNGRVYQVSQFLSGLDGIRFAEPNHIMLSLDDLSTPMLPAIAPDRRVKGGAGGKGSKRNSPVNWDTLVNESCEGVALPGGWTTGSLSAVTNAFWNVTNAQSHAGNQSCYATGAGPNGVAAPGPYPNNSDSWLDTPTVNLAAYEEVYIEFWFHAIYEDPPWDYSYRDYGRVGIHDTTTGNIEFFYPDNHPVLAVPYTGDLTTDLTTDNGWRRALFRVPPDLRLNGVRVRFVFQSDGNNTAEGLYIDEVRVVGTADVDTEPVSNDTYGARHYGMKNAGQIAGLGNDNTDMEVPEAWNRVSISNDVVVAIIDDGVDLTHPDLTLVTGYDWDGTGDGHARRSHGTACAGAAGAIGDNSLGVLGTAPGVNIMPIYKGGSWSDYAEAIDTAVGKGADILSNSWGAVNVYIQTVEDAVIDALNASRVVVFAAGNGPDRNPWSYNVAFPGNLTGSTNVITVGASSPTDEHKGVASSDGSHRWGSSYVGDGPDIVAPSPWCYTTDRQGADGYNPSSANNPYPNHSLIDPGNPASEDYNPMFGGTSCATPKVAGIVALMLSANPDLTPYQVKTILRETADDIDAPGVDDRTGAGRVNAEEAVKSALATPRRHFLPLYLIPLID